MSSLSKEFEKQKIQILKVVEEAKSSNLIDEKEFNELKQKIESENLTIGIIGQMKYGKSTFLNAFLFQKEFLPTSDTPMTAALSVIEKGDKPKFEVEFFSKEEWEIIEKQSKNDKIFEDTVNKARELGANLYELLGSKKEISIEEFEDYVGADGKYTPITKMLTIKHPTDKLDDVIVVDTPGFNDPVESREKRTEEFLKQANILLLFLYAERPFDDTDRNLVIDKLKNVGNGKVVFVVNKADILLENEGNKEKVLNYINEKIKESINLIESKEYKNILSEAPIIPVSSLLALLGYMSDEDISNNEDLKWYYNDFKEKFILKSKEDFIKTSGFNELEDTLKNIVKNDKVKILIRSLKTSLEGYLNNKKIQMLNDIQNIELKIKAILVNISNEQIDNFEKEKELLKDKIVKSLSIFQNTIIDKYHKEDDKWLQTIDQFYNDMISFIDNYKIGIWSQDEFATKFNSKINQKLVDIKASIKKDMTSFYKEVRREVQQEIVNITKEIRIILNKMNLHILIENEEVSRLNQELFSNDTLNKMRRSIEKIDELFSELSLKANIFGFGDNDAEAKSKALKVLKKTVYKMKTFIGDEINSKFEDEIKALTAKESKKEGSIMMFFEEKIEKPIEERLNILKENRNKSIEEIEKLKKELLNKQQELKEFELKSSVILNKLERI